MPDHDPRRRPSTLGRRRTQRAILAALALVIVGACGDDGTRPEPEEGYPSVTMVPSEGAPGTIVSIESAVLDGADGEALAVRIDGHLAPLRWMADGRTLTAVPLPAAGPAGDDPPEGDVVVTIVDVDDNIVARSEGAFAVTPIEPAAGATDTLLKALEGLTSSIAASVTLAEPDTTEFDVYGSAVVSALDSLLNGPGEESLASLLQQLDEEDPQTRALLDAVLSASGVVESMGRLAEAFGGMSAPGQASLAPDGLLPANIELSDSDVDLAARMQFYTVARLVGETVIGETAEEYDATVGFATGILGISTRNIPVAGQIGAALAVIDFVTNKVLLGLYPATLTNFEIVLEHDRLSPGDTTFARLDIEARNDPPETSLFGLIDVITASSSLGGRSGDLEVREFREALEKLAGYVQDKIESALQTFITDDLGLNIDPSFSVVPELVWTAVSHDPRLFELQTHTPVIIVPVDDELNWHAAGPVLGEGRIYARTAVGEDAVVIDLPLGFSYEGGAFGESVIGTETRSVYVQGDLVMEIDFTEALEDDDIVPLEVRAGHLGIDDEPIWEPGIDIELIVDGGTVEDETGATDADGEFITLAQLLPDSDSILITVTARDSTGQEVVRTVRAGSGGGATVQVTSTHAAAGAAAAGGWTGYAHRNLWNDCVNPEGDPYCDPRVDELSGSIALQSDTSIVFENDSVSLRRFAESSATSIWAVEVSEDGDLESVSWSGDLAGQSNGSINVPEGSLYEDYVLLVSGSSFSYFSLEFEVADESTEVAVDFSASGTSVDWEFRIQDFSGVWVDSGESGVSTTIELGPGTYIVYFWMIVRGDVRVEGPVDSGSNSGSGGYSGSIILDP